MDDQIQETATAAEEQHKAQKAKAYGRKNYPEPHEENKLKKSKTTVDPYDDWQQQPGLSGNEGQGGGKK